MPRSLSARAEQTHANSGSASATAALDAIRAGSAMARIDANRSANPREIDSRELVAGLMADLQLSQKSMALQAECPASDLSNALQRKQRLEIDWLLRQEPIFVAMLIERIERAMGFTERSERELKAARIAELVRLLVEVA